MLNIKGLKENVTLAPFTTYKIGGPADFFVEVKSSDELAAAVIESRAKNMPYFILGTGANILITDKGFRGLVVRNLANNFEFLNLSSDSSPMSADADHGRRELLSSSPPGSKDLPFPLPLPNEMRIGGDGRRPEGVALKAESGAVVADLIQECLKRGLSGLEHFVGIPSSVGGAIWQNLHFLNPDRSGTAFISEIVENGKILGEDNTIKEVDRDFFKFGYDDSILHHKNLIVLEVTLKLTPKSQDKIRHVMEQNMAWRCSKQPQLWEYASCGSVFKKIEGAGAGRLIEKAGLKGHQIGKIKVSEKHANYLVNLGGASSSDVLAMIEHIQEQVEQKTGHLLEPEISIVGEK